VDKFGQVAGIAAKAVLDAPEHPVLSASSVARTLACGPNTTALAA
jgi:hypothetical protein